MQLKRLEIQGFKTFVEPVRFNFEYPIVAIVGPNGSGKSNIVDAVKWCMGEQSTRQLRANQMADLIFNGSEHRKSTGMADVSLIFSNNGTDEATPYASFSVYLVTRRMFRGQESEYYLNKDAKRLRDVLEFLMDIGISSKAFSIIEQGQIGEIIDAKPEVRRYVIEDAAGILKYKSRKKLALDKIELTKANVARITDLLSEIKRQLGQVNKQVKVAQEYKSLKEEYRLLDLGILKTEYLRFVSILADRKAALEQVRFEVAKLAARAASRYTDQQRFKDRLDKQWADITGKQDRINGLSSESMLLKEKIESSKKLREALQKQNERIRISMDDLAGREVYLREQIATESARLEEEQREMGSLSELLGVYESEKNGLVERTNSIKEKIEEERNNEFSRARTIAEIDNQIVSVEHDIENTAHRIEKAEHDGTLIEQKIATLRDEKAGLEKQESINAARIKETDDYAALAGDQLAALEGEMLALTDTLEQAKKTYESTRSRYDTLADLRKNLEGYSDGTRFVLKQADAFNIDKVVADYINVKPGYELAVQAILGDLLQGLVVPDRRTAEEIVGALRRQDKGRAVFLVRSDFKGPDPAAGHDGVPVLDIIDVREGSLLPVFRALLGDVSIVPSLRDAAAIADRGGTAVTIAGDVVKPGIIYGGSEGAIKGGILDRRSELDRLKLEIDGLSDMLGKYEADRSDRVGKISALNLKLAEYSSEKQELEKQQSSVRTKIQNIEEQMSDNEKSLLLLKMEVEELKKGTSELYEEAGDLRGKRAIYEEDKGTNASLIDGLKNELSDAESHLEDKKDAISACNAKAAGVKERLNARSYEIKRMQTEHESIQGQIASLGQEFESNSGRVRTMEEEATTAGGRLAGMSEEIQKIQNEISDAKVFYDRELKESSDIEREIRQIEKDASALRERESALAIENSELTMKASYCNDTSKDKYGTSLDQYETEPIPEEAMAKSRERLALLSERIARMGDVNIGAISEHEELQGRVDFYERHKQDLEKAIDDLKKVIQSINRESRKLFREVFDRVNENFKKVVPKLFEGGKGELVLTDEQDLLESGMEIVIQPQGKRLQNISLLSGGEKALSAVALLISVFMVRPSPFALLDEIDAPLDDASVSKLNNLIKELSANTQFILITHNKRTIEIADVIYGITMEEPGVSKIISVKLQKEPA
ncbi:MAG: chromosome segregation protein SMC [Deltaproteobacteria bacterium]|nr:chromosome segregation protein SMC [Deltaproteobacteria bacterium]